MSSRTQTVDDLSMYEEEKKKPTLSANRQQRYDSLYENYLSDTKALDEQKSLAEQEARINHELLMKYLPTLNKQNGLYGLGVAQSANVEALANYQNNLNAIDRNYRASKSELDRSWNNSQLSLYDQQATEDREDSLAAYNEAYDLIVAGAETKTKDEIDNYINSLDVDEATKERLGSLANYLYGDETEEQARYTAKGTFGSDGVVNVNINGVSVSLMKGEPVSLPSKATSGINDGEVFTYDKGIYIKQSGVVTQLFDENGDYTGGGYSDVYKYLTTGEPITQGPKKPTSNKESEPASFTRIVKGTYENSERGSVTVDGKTYDFTIYPTAEEIPGIENAVRKYYDGEVFGYNNKLYVIYRSKPHEITTARSDKLYESLKSKNQK